jgi:hypothetical protein
MRRAAFHFVGRRVWCGHLILFYMLGYYDSLIKKILSDF